MCRTLSALPPPDSVPRPVPGPRARPQPRPRPGPRPCTRHQRFLGLRVVLRRGQRPEQRSQVQGVQGEEQDQETAGGDRILPRAEEK